MAKMRNLDMLRLSNGMAMELVRDKADAEVSQRTVDVLIENMRLNAITSDRLLAEIDRLYMILDSAGVEY